ncbi:hypothetical protein [Streptomyces sp. NBC_01601]|uniref:hypothetical protein n=1 Tax=Streptomyces sp. NBC_01601 TaxID=2975892 RepID=UPI002E2B699C|nr:hypothetical protein [Streptomyces sp. NBC_01601]
MAEPVGDGLQPATHLRHGSPAGTDQPAGDHRKASLTCEDVGDDEQFIRLMIQLALAGERVSGASEEGGIVTTADETADRHHGSLPPEAPSDSTIPEWAPPLPTKAPEVPLQKAPAAEEPRRPMREGRGGDWWTRPVDSGSPWPSPGSLAPAEEDDSAGHEREPQPSDEGDTAREHPRHEAEPVVNPEPVVKESDGDDGRGHITQQVRDAFTPLLAEVRDLRARFERPYEPSDDAVENGKRLRRIRIRRYGIPLVLVLCPIPPVTPFVGPVLGGYSLASVYASIPQSLEADSGWSMGWAAVAALAPTSLVVVRLAAHLKARSKPGFTLRVATSAMVCGSVMYGPVGAYVLYLMNGHIA